MTDDQLELIMEARDSIAAAKLLLEGEFPGYAASRSYFAMFYIAEALLEGEGLSFSKLDMLTPYGTLFRYEDLPAEVELDRETFFKMVRSLHEFVEKRLS